MQVQSNQEHGKSFSGHGKNTKFRPYAPTCCDGYKIGHASLYPNAVNFTYGNGTPRSDRLFQLSHSCGTDFDHKVVWIGVQGVLREVHGMWQESFFDAPKEEAIARYSERMAAYLGDSEANVSYLSRLHDIGYLPVTVLSIKEGSRLNMNVPGYVIYAFGEHYWVTNYLETIFSNLLWKGINNGTIAYEFRKIIDKALEETGAPANAAIVMGHDFSMRGVDGIWAAAASNFPHLASFVGTDTLPSIDFGQQMYDTDPKNHLVGISVMATEHAVTTTNILYEALLIEKANPGKYTEKELRALGERAFIKRAITQVQPSGFISLVSDSFDFWKILDEILPSLKEEIYSRVPDALGNAKVVVRPDSGDPVDVICGMEVFEYAELAAYEDFAGDVIGKTAAFIRDSVDNTKRKFGREAQLARGMVLVTHSGAFYRAFRRGTETFHDEAEKIAKLATIHLSAFELVPVAAWPLTAEEKGAVQTLWEHFGGSTTHKGYKVLHERIGLIYGDSITVHRALEIFRRLKKKGFAANNIVFGIGSYTYQYSTRDTFGFAVKATACRVGDDFVPLFKAPATEGDTMKKSAKGLLKVVKEGDDFILLQDQDLDINNLENESGELKLSYKDGVFYNQTTLPEIRDLLHPNFFGA